MFAVTLSPWFLFLNKVFWIILQYLILVRQKSTVQQATSAIASASAHKQTDADAEFWQFPCKQQL